MRNRRGSPLLFLSIIAVIQFSAYLQGPSDQDQELRDLLKKVADYCDRLENAVLDVICTERVAERIYNPIRSFKSSASNIPYTMDSNDGAYDYQLIRKGGRKTEKRTPLEKEYATFLDENLSLKTRRFDYEYIIFGPVGLLSRSRQPEYAYRNAGPDILGKIRTFVVAVYPRDMKAGTLPLAKVWIDETDFSVMKIEWDQKTLKNYSNIEMTANGLKAIPQVGIVSEYGVQKNGLRFPSKFTLREEYQTAAALLIKSTLTAEYTNYRFFTVETRVDRVLEKK